MFRNHRSKISAFNAISQFGLTASKNHTSQNTSQPNTMYANIISYRIIFRLAVLAYRCQHNMAPRYLTVQLNRVSSVGHRQRLRSSSSAVLDIPRTNRATIGDRAFNVSAARAWNSLTTAVQSSESLGTFCRRLKAELFTRSYS